MPSPFLYGLVSGVAGDPKSRWPLAIILYSEFFTLTMMTYVILKKLRRENLDLVLSKAEAVF